MNTALSQNERQALARFLAKVVEDVDKLASLFESRGVDSTVTRSAETQLKTTLETLQQDPAADPAAAEDNFHMRACVSQDL
jgi:hypothetical protein